MESPPPSTFASLREAEQAVRTFVRAQEYALSRALSIGNKAGAHIRKLWLKRMHGRACRRTGNSQRRTSTIRTGKLVSQDSAVHTPVDRMSVCCARKCAHEPRRQRRPGRVSEPHEVDCGSLTDNCTDYDGRRDAAIHSRGAP